MLRIDAQEFNDVQFLGHGIQHNDTQHNGLNCDTSHNYTQRQN
jgi:hypothetical protein